MSVLSLLLELIGWMITILGLICMLAIVIVVVFARYGYSFELHHGRDKKEDDNENKPL